MQWDNRRWMRSCHRLPQYLHPLVSPLGRVERRDAAHIYVSGLLAPGNSKSLELMAKAHGVDVQRLQQFLSDSPWDEDQLWSGVREITQRLLGPPSAWVLYESVRVKQGLHSVGVEPQYTTTLGKRANCQVAINLLVSDGYAAAPIGARLFMPLSWCNDLPRRTKAGVPDELTYLGKPALALHLIENAIRCGMAPGPVLGDESYGDSAELRQRLNSLGLRFSFEISPHTPACAAGDQLPTSLLRLAQDIPESERERLHWEDRKGRKHTTQLACLKVRVMKEGKPGQALWLLADWEDDDGVPRLFITNIPQCDGHRALQLIRGRQLVAEHFATVNEQMGFHQLEARNWRAFHHHLALTGVAYSFMLAERIRRQKALSLFVEWPGTSPAATATAPPPGVAAAAPMPRASSHAS